MRHRWLAIGLIIFGACLFASYRSSRRYLLVGLYDLHPMSVTRGSADDMSGPRPTREFKFSGESVQASRKYLESTLLPPTWHVVSKNEMFESFSDSPRMGGHDVTWYLIDGGAKAKVGEVEKPQIGRWRAYMPGPKRSTTPLTVSSYAIYAPMAGFSPATKDLFEACQTNDFALAKKAIAAGADVNTHYVLEETPLYHALRQPDLAIATYMLDHGADPNIGVGGKPVLNSVCSDGRLDAVKLLISKGAKWNRADPLVSACNVKSPIDNNASALHLVAWNSTVEWDQAPKLAEFLIQRGARVNTDQYGDTPLQQAAISGHPQLVRLLLAHGADPTWKDRDGYLASDYARMNQRNQWRVVVDILNQASREYKPKPK